MALKLGAGPFILAFGGENFFLDQILEMGSVWKNRVVRHLDGDGLDTDRFIEICETRSFDSDDRVVLLDNAQDLKGDKGGKTLKNYIEAKSASDLSTIIVAVFRTEKLPDAWKEAIAKGTQRHFPKFKPWEDDKVKKAIRDEAERLKLTLNKEAVDTLVLFLGTDLGLIVGELKKLFWLVGEGGVVQRQHVMLVVSPSMPAKSFEVADAAADKNVKKAMNKLSLLYKESGDKASVPIVASLLKLAEQLIVARQMLDKGDGADIIGTRFEMHRVRVERYLLPMARKHTVSELRDQMKRLCKLDAQVKSSASSKQTLVELAVLSFAA